MTLGSDIFVSSTCYDLIDLRAAVAEALRDMGLHPRLSDDYQSDFIAQPSKDSIETCLINVRDADTFLVILSQRYGRSLQDSGFDDVSATHLEYRTAREATKPILFYVRDQTMAEYDGWKANKDYNTRYVVNDKDKNNIKQNHRIFELIDEHKKLKRDGGTNWITPFTTSVDLIRKIQKDLAAPSGKALLQSLAEKGELPEIRITGITGTAPSASHLAPHNIAVTFENHGQSAADQPQIRLRQQSSKSPTFSGLGRPIPPGKSTISHFTLASASEQQGPYAIIDFSYRITRGWRIMDTFMLDATLNIGYYGKTLVEKATVICSLPDDPWQQS